MTLHDRVMDLVADVEPTDAEAAAAARRRFDGLVKPRGSLGRLEDVGARLAAIAGACPPPVPRQPAVVVAAGDHGVHARGVTAWPQEITRQMVAVMADGRAAVNAVAATVGARVSVLDVGVAGDRFAHPLVRSARVRDGTADLYVGPAMTADEAAQAVLAGAGIVEELAAAGVDLVVTGDMGIANTTPSACLIAAMTGAQPADVTGRGAGVDDAMLAHKRDVIATALALHSPDRSDPLRVLGALGGLEHAALVGVILAAAAERLPVVLDGVITVAAALVALTLCPAAAGYVVAGHRSPEPGASVGLQALGLDPLLDVGMRLGEGTGGLLAVPMVAASARTLADMAAITDLMS